MIIIYDNENPFKKIIDGLLPCKKIFENDNAMSFYDINPEAPIHFLVIPKKDYSCFSDFIKRASMGEKEDFFNAINKSCEINKLNDNYRMISNSGETSGQTVFHFHIHILAGKNFTKLC